MRKIIRVLDVPVCECRRPTGKSVGGSSRQSIEVLRNRSDRKCFQEKPLSFSLTMAVPQTDTGGRVEDTKALERTQVKELGKIVP